MAPKRGTKRAAAAAEENQAKKQQVNPLRDLGISNTLYRTIVEVLEHPLAGLSEPCRGMLFAMLPTSLCILADQRHEYQHAAVNMYFDVLKTLEGKLEEGLEKEKEIVAVHETSKGGLDGAVEETKEALEAAKGVTNEKETEHAAATEVLVNAKAALAKCQQEQQEGDKAFNEAKQQKEHLEATRDGPLKQLVEGEIEGPAAKQLYTKEFAPVLELLEAVDTLKHSLPACLLKKPETRGQFDKMVQQEITALFTNKIQQLEAQIEAAAPEAEQRAAAVTAAADVVAEAEKALAEATERLTEAQEAQTAAEAVHRAAEQRLEAYEPEYKAATKLRDEKEEYLTVFKTFTMVSFVHLKERTTKKPKEAEAPAEDEAMTEEKPAEEPVAQEVPMVEAA